MLHHAVLRAAEVASSVVVVLAPGAPVPPMPPGVVVGFTRDAVEGQGPLEAVHAGLLATGSDLALLVAGDMPELVTPVLVEMLHVAREASVEAVALQDGDRFRPLPSVVRAAPALDATEALLLGGRRRLRDLLGALRIAVVDEATWQALDPERRTLFDVDELGDLER
jgi:molybdopterin-guanine dinucleotide biosynthesis protein A